MGSKDDLAKQAWLHLTALFIGGKNSDRFPRTAVEVGLTPGQMKVLLDLRGDPKPMRMLAQQMACDASYATALIDGLENLGYVERQVSPTDRRIKLVHLTPAGRDLQAQIVAKMAVPPPTFQRLSAAELRTLRDLLMKVTDDFPF